MSIQAYNSLFMLILINFRAILRVKNFKKSKISSKILKFRNFLKYFFNDLLCIFLVNFPEQL